MSKKDKKIKKLQAKIEALTSRIDSLEDFLSNIVSKGIASIFEANGFDASEDELHENEDENNCLLTEEDFSLFTADEEDEEEDDDIEVEFFESTKSDKKKAKKEKKKAKKQAKKNLENISDENEEDEDFEEEDEDNEEDFLHNISDNQIVNLNEDFAMKEQKKSQKSSNEHEVEDITTMYTTDLQQLNGIGPALAEKLQNFGIKTIEDLVQLSAEDEMRINESIKGFSKKMTTFQWKEKSKEILDSRNDNTQ